MVEGEPHYAVMYGNVQLAGEDQRRYKNIRRRMGISKSGKGGNVKPGVRVPTDFETRAKYDTTGNFAAAGSTSKNTSDDSEEDDDPPATAQGERKQNKDTFEEDDDPPATAKGKRKQNKDTDVGDEGEKDDKPVPKDKTKPTARKRQLAKGKDRMNNASDEDNNEATAKAAKKTPSIAKGSRAR